METKRKRFLIKNLLVINVGANETGEVHQRSTPTHHLSSRDLRHTVIMYGSRRVFISICIFCLGIRNWFELQIKDHIASRDRPTIFAKQLYVENK